MIRYKIGITFGAFDPLHYGHIRLFKRTKDVCDKFIVCVSSSEYIWENKNRTERFPLEQRIEAVRSIRYVDMVDVQCDLFNKKDAVSFYNADAIFVGDDWTPETFSGEGLGATVVYLPRTPNISSSLLSPTGPRAII